MENSEPKNQQISSRRWIMLFIVSCLGFVEFMACFSFASVPSETAEIYNVEIIWVNWLVNTYAATFIPSIFIAIFLFQFKGVRFSALYLAFLIVLGCWFRVLSRAGHGNFPLLLIGQMLTGLPQATAYLLPTRMSTDWFGINEYSLANTVGIYAGSLGIAAGFMMPSYFTDGGMLHMENYLLFQAILTTVIFLTVYFGYAEKPNNTPSLIASRRVLASVQNSTDSDDSNEYCEVVEKLSSAQDHAEWMDRKNFLDSKKQKSENIPKLFLRFGKQLIFEWVQLLSQNSSLRFLCLTFSMVYGAGIAFSACIAEYLMIYDYSSVQSSVAGVATIFIGFLIASFTSLVTDRWHNYNTVIKFMTGVFFFSTTILVFVIVERHFDAMIVLVGIPFGFANAFVPHALELGVEYTFPLSEDVSSGLLVLTGSIGGLIFTEIFGELLLLRPVDGTKVFNAGNLFILLVSAGSFFLSLLCNGKYNRVNSSLEDNSLAEPEDIILEGINNSPIERRRSLSFSAMDFGKEAQEDCFITPV